MEELFGTSGLAVIGFLIAALVLTWRILWKGLLDRMDRLDAKMGKLYEKLDVYLRDNYEDKEKFVLKSYMETDIKPWIRDLEEQIKAIRNHSSKSE